jgi:hypothetical protein
LNLTNQKNEFPTSIARKSRQRLERGASAPLSAAFEHFPAEGSQN